MRTMKEPILSGKILFAAVLINVVFAVLLATGLPRKALALTQAATDGKPLRFHFWDTNVDGSIDQILFTVANQGRQEWVLAGSSPYGLKVYFEDIVIPIRQVSIAGGQSNPFAYIQVDLDESVFGSTLRQGYLTISYQPETGDSGCSTSCIKGVGTSELQAFSVQIWISGSDELLLS